MCIRDSYTIRVMDGNAALLQACASDPGKFYDVTQSSEITAAFDSLAGKLQQEILTR